MIRRRAALTATRYHRYGPPLTVVGPPDTLQAFMGEQPYDLLIRGGIVIDGTGAPAAGADIVVFDPQVVADTATYEEPRQYPRGIEYVVVNGQVVVEKGKQTGARPGWVLRRGQESIRVQREG